MARHVVLQLVPLSTPRAAADALLQQQASAVAERKSNKQWKRCYKITHALLQITLKSSQNLLGAAQDTRPSPTNSS
jgi:hypothetical protein